MNIALDATYSLGRHLTGVGVYSRRLLFGLAEVHPDTRFAFQYRPHRFLRSFRELLPPNVRRELMLGNPSSSFDLFHGLNQRVDSDRHRRTIVTFHDLFVLTGNYSTPDFRSRFAGQARLAAERADLIIAVSAFTADQVHDLLGVERARLRVVHHGLRPPSPRLAIPRDKTILFVGALQHRKNLLRLIEAFESVAPGDWSLILVGSAGFGAEEIVQRAHANPRIKIAGYLSDAELEDVYSRAAVFAFPSLDEGFGMPVLDAMARGVPVLASNRSALPEVAGEAALLVDPFDVESIGGGLRKLLESEALRLQMAQKGFAQAAGFSWEKAVRETWAVYGELLR